MTPTSPLERRADLEVDARDEVLYVDLMLQDEQRNDVALVGEVRAGIEQSLQSVEVAAAHLIEMHELLHVVDQDIPEVHLIARMPGHVPAAPAVLERRLRERDDLPLV